MRNLGLIGGLAPGATIHYYRQLAKAQAGELLIVHADLDRVLGHVERDDRSGLASYFARLIERLARGGAEVAAISAFAPHICIRELRQISVLPIVNIVDEVLAEIRSRGLKKVALFGTRFVVQSRLFGMLDGVDVLVPDEVEAIHQAYMQIAAGNTDARITLSQIARGLPVDAVVLAGTDLSTVFDETNTDFPHVDGTAAHIRGIIRKLHTPRSELN